MSKHSYTLTLDLGLLGEREVDIEYSYSAGRPAVMYLRNGDPGYPEEPAELYITKVSLNGIELPDSIWDNDAFQEVVIDQLSAYHSEDY